VKQPPRSGTELALLTFLVWVGMISIPLGLGGIGLGWDALNHHIYLGWVAEHARFDRDYLAASYQGYLYPYLYWPAFRLMQGGATGVTAGVVLATLNASAVPALWIVARVCMPEATWHAAAMRAAAVLLAVSGQLTLSLMDTTANDILAASPLVWAAALALLAMDNPIGPRWLTRSRCVALSGVLAGVSVAFKFSNGPLAILMPVLWLACGPGLRERLLQAVRGSAWTLAGFAVAYGSWGWALWQQFGNPMYPFYDHWFAILRAWTGHTGWAP
jgi:hypothetical protein